MIVYLFPCMLIAKGKILNEGIIVTTNFTMAGFVGKCTKIIIPYYTSINYRILCSPCPQYLLSQ